MLFIARYSGWGIIVLVFLVGAVWGQTGFRPEHEFGEARFTIEAVDFRGDEKETSVLEVYYKIFVKEWCSLTLDIQTLLNTGTNSNNDNAVIPGFRLKILL